MNKDHPKFRVGTSGVVVPTPKQLFPPEYQQSSRLTYYASFFDTLEINSTFYKLPRKATLQRWIAEVPDAFQFTFKLWRDITHAKKLSYSAEHLEAFFEVLDQPDSNNTCLLIQFPASITFEYFAEIKKLLMLITGKDNKNQWRKAVEFRSESWYNSETNSMLDDCGASLVLHDMPKSKWLTPNKDAPFAYYRFHGPTGNYRDSYSDDFLHQQSRHITNLLNDGKDVYAYFNNTMGDAFNNAISLKQMVEGF
ncbi:DUF72 domain-containing protein [Segetibacter sp. 3557_3]|uniref:DUF72 domain-containing protein n=1 Tax=Segetibacter sp. 3557_3 TaxID=2547429 RepID=UPI0010590210|nr:DUF72 domain-containing protein [Segetibacter sp. 3557_3]TDH26621.1 DUF72 domain-containing protein [Segetibacter sp. 3557_3]